jgi:hypothetical protein
MKHVKELWRLLQKRTKLISKNNFYYIFSHKEIKMYLKNQTMHLMISNY